MDGVPRVGVGWRTGDAIGAHWRCGTCVCSRARLLESSAWDSVGPVASETACRIQPRRIELLRGSKARGCSRRVGRPAPGDVAGASRRRVRCRGAQAVEAAVRRGRLVLRRSGGGRPGHGLVKDWSRGATHLHGSPLRAGRQDLVVGEQQGRTEGDAQPASEGGAPRTTCHARMYASK